MKKLTPSQIQTVSKNLDKYLKKATSQDFEDGLKWYREANKFCLENAQRFNLKPFDVAQVLSALSPRNKWERNKLDAIAVIKAYQAGISPENISVSTFHRNKYKAFDILAGKARITPESKKTFAFCENIAHLNEAFITVDIWHLRACFNKTKSNVGALAYEQLQRITKRKAAAHGLTGFELQAIIWHSVKTNF